MVKMLPTIMTKDSNTAANMITIVAVLDMIVHVAGLLWRASNRLGTKLQIAYVSSQVGRVVLQVERIAVMNILVVNARLACCI